MKGFRILSLLVMVALLVSACAQAATTPTSAPVAETPAVEASAPAQETAAPAVTAAATEMPATAAMTAEATLPPATEAVTAAATEAPAATAVMSATVAATTPVTATAAVTSTSGGTITIPAVDPASLVQKGKLLICTDFPYPPQEFYDDAGNPQGLDIEIGTEIAKRLSLQPVFVNSVFDTIIAAVSAGKCDVIISAMNITVERQKKVSMIPYFQAGQAFVVQKGDPQNIKTVQDLCGKSVAAESGTTEADYLQGTGDYNDKGLSLECTNAGKQPIKTVVTQKDTDALQQLQAGKVVAYFTDSPVAAYYTIQHPDQFELAGPVLEPAQEGFALPCGQADCTNQPLTPLGQSIQAALKSMMADGTYLQILKKWNLESSAIQP